MIYIFTAKLKKLQAELAMYEQLRINADNQELADRAMDLGRETLAQIWDTKKQMENNNNNKEFSHVTEPTT